MPLRRWLCLLVHPRDVLGASASRGAVEQALRSGALDVLQLRSTENDSDEQVLAAGKILVELSANARRRHDEDRAASRQSWTRIVVNHESLELAVDVGADGWHMKEKLVAGKTQCDLERDVSAAKRQNLVVGCSAHSVETAMVAARSGFGYIQVGTMFPTPSHPEKAQVEGPELLCRIRHELEEVSAQKPPALPALIAVGGIDSEDHVSRVISAGADGVAVIRGILADEQPDKAAGAYRAWLDHREPE